ncbi:MAG: hypothetical protein ABJJ37_24990 [Roseibium sp.]
MTRARTLKDEVSQLKTDADRKSPKRRGHSTQPAKEQSAPDPEDEAANVDEQTEQLKDLTEQLSDLVHDAEIEIREHPIALVLGAFAVGVVVGAVLRR